MNEVPNAAADEASEAPEGASTEASRRRAAWWCLRLKMAVSEKRVSFNSIHWNWGT